MGLRKRNTRASTRPRLLIDWPERPARSLSMPSRVCMCRVHCPLVPGHLLAWIHWDERGSVKRTLILRAAQGL